MRITAIHEYCCEPPRYKIAVQGQGADYKDALGIVLDRLETGPPAKVKVWITAIHEYRCEPPRYKIGIQGQGSDYKDTYRDCFRPSRNISVVQGRGSDHWDAWVLF